MNSYYDYYLLVWKFFGMKKEVAYWHFINNSVAVEKKIPNCDDAKF